MKRTLIVNADDCNLTPGVTRAILEAHDTGIVSSTTFMANLPVSEKTFRAILKRKSLGVGIHLNITFGRPVASSIRVKSLLNLDGNFLGVGATGRSPLRHRASEVGTEYEAQIGRFRKVFGRLPTHLDTHHQIHDHPFYFKVLSETARRHRLPMRRSKLLMQRAYSEKLSGMKVPSPDYFFGNLSPEGYWRKEALECALINLPEGVSELMCHPGISDAELAAVSSFREGRQKEYNLLRDPRLRRLLERTSIRLAHFGLCYT